MQRVGLYDAEGMSWTSVISSYLRSRCVRRSGKPRSLQSHVALGFSHAPAFPLRRLLIVGCSLHVADQALFLAQFLETPNHLLDGLARSHLHL